MKMLLLVFASLVIGETAMACDRTEIEKAFGPEFEKVRKQATQEGAQFKDVLHTDTEISFSLTKKEDYGTRFYVATVASEGVTKTFLIPVYLVMDSASCKLKSVKSVTEELIKAAN